MPPVKVDPAKVKTFENAIALERWLGAHHNSEDEVWIRIYKVGSGLKSITPKEPIDVCLLGLDRRRCASDVTTRAICSATRADASAASGAKSVSTTSRG